MNTQPSPHQGQRMLRAGAPANRAKAAMILVHGRGASAESMLSLADVFAQPDFAYLAPQAAIPPRCASTIRSGGPREPRRRTPPENKTPGEEGRRAQ